MLRLIGVLVTVLGAIGVAIITWPQFFRLERTFPIAQVVSLRGVVVVVLVTLLVVALLLAMSRRMRAFAASVALVCTVGAVANAGILSFRGIDTGTLPEPTPDSVRVMTWNTEGTAVDPLVIAQTAVAMQADIVALPETSAQTGEAVAVAMREMGQRMWAHDEEYEGWEANSTALLISAELGTYAVVTSSVDGAANTSTVPSVVAMPVDGEDPIVVAAHAVAPRASYMDQWRGDLQWLADQCATDNVILAGDFNATVDHMARLGTDGGDLGRCRDGATATGSGGVGTWSTGFPALLGTPIDHVLATPDWKPTGSVVLTSLDARGSDHRPVIVQLDPASENN